MNQNGLIREMNEINAEVSGLLFKKRKWKAECNVMGCRNKPVHKLYLEQYKRTLWCCKKHRVDYGEQYLEVKA